MIIEEEENSLEILQIIISEHFNFTNITDNEFYNIVTKDCCIDLTNFDLSSVKDYKEELISWLNELQEKKQAIQKLEALFIYIDNQGYELETFLNFVNYNLDDFDISTLSLDNLNYIEEQIQSLVSEVDNKIELEQLEKDLEFLENSKKSTNYMEPEDFFDAYLNDDKDSEIEALKKKIEALELNQKKTLKHTLEELQIVQVKDFLSTKELAILYPNMSVETQKLLRGRMKDALPFHQLKRRGKITYDRKLIDIWRINEDVK